MADTVLHYSQIEGIPLLKRGKTRDVYDLGKNLLIVASDRISCFDVVLPTPIPGKGSVLTALSLFWFYKTESIIANHLVFSSIEQFPQELKRYGNVLKGRSLLVRK